MARKTPGKHRQARTKTYERQLKKLANGNTPTGLIAHELERSEASFRGKASEIGQSL